MDGLRPAQKKQLPTGLSRDRAWLWTQPLTRLNLLTGRDVLKAGALPPPSEYMLGKGSDCVCSIHLRALQHRGLETRGSLRAKIVSPTSTWGLTEGKDHVCPLDGLCSRSFLASFSNL